MTNHLCLITVPPLLEASIPKQCGLLYCFHTELLSLRFAPEKKISVDSYLTHLNTY